MKEKEFISICEDFIEFQKHREKDKEYANKSDLMRIYRLLYHLAYRNEDFITFITTERKSCLMCKGIEALKGEDFCEDCIIDTEKMED